MSAPAGSPLLPAPAARLIGVGLLAAWGAHHWMLMVEPAPAARAWAATGLALLVAGGLLACRRLSDGSRAAAVAGAVVAAGLLASILVAGGPARLLAPAGWTELVAGVARGLDALAGVRVPYRGLDEWLAYVIVLGGPLLAVAGAALACWPRRGARTGSPPAAVVALVTLYAVPAVSLDLEGEFLRGAVLVLLVLAFLRLEGLRRREGAPAAAVAVGAAVAALALAPALDGLDPWWDYETWALSAAGARTTAYGWEHDYGALRWPRDGRELLRVRSPVRTYWKAEQLDVFNGRSWARDTSAEGARQAPGTLTEGVDPRLERRWSVRLRFAVRHLRTDTFVVGGAVQDIRMPREPELPTTRPGVYRAARTLTRGDAYEVTAYVPQPDERLLRSAGADYGAAMERYTRVGVRSGGDGNGLGGQPRTTVVAVPGFGATPTVASLDPLGGREPAGGLLRDSELRRPTALARRLRARAATPLDYVERIEAHLRRGFRYSETPPAGSDTLDGFLFETRTGFCQQYAGAMALLLRLGGVPARVASGFSPGSYDENTREYVVRDHDAHSWVEVWFPGVGWVPRDPTPTSAPPRSQQAPEAGGASLPRVPDVGTGAAGATAPAAPGDHLPLWTLPAGLAVAGVGAAGARAAHRRRRRRRPRGRVRELERALRIAGGGLPAGTTLAALERRLADDAPAAAYVRELRAERFAPVPPVPAPGGRRALRRALGRGGAARRLRAWWALPPRLRG